jgi:hypothetical protein
VRVEVFGFAHQDFMHERRGLGWEPECDGRCVASGSGRPAS